MEVFESYTVQTKYNICCWKCDNDMERHCESLCLLWRYFGQWWLSLNQRGSLEVSEVRSLRRGHVGQQILWKRLKIGSKTLENTVVCTNAPHVVIILKYLSYGVLQIYFGFLVLLLLGKSFACCASLILDNNLPSLWAELQLCSELNTFPRKVEDRNWKQISN